MSEPADDGRLEPLPEPRVDRRMPLIPRDSIAGGALVVVVAIMTFLACLTAGSALLVAQASEAWRTDVLREVTIQVKPGPNDDVDRLVDKVASIAAKAAGTGAVHAYTADDSRKLLQPWLGAGLDLTMLPVPRIIVVDMVSEGDADIAQLRATLAQEARVSFLLDFLGFSSPNRFFSRTYAGRGAEIFLSPPPSVRETADAGSLASSSSRPFAPNPTASRTQDSRISVFPQVWLLLR